jgi:alkylation response protein AidB-like acyl-CoA dehydrogenase
MGIINFNNEQKLIQNEVRKFAKAEIESLSSELDRECVFPTEIVERLFELGLLCLIVPEKYGGSGLDTTSLCVAIEEISKACASIGTILVVNNCLVAYAIMKYGDESQKQKYLGKLAKGEIGGYVPNLEIEIPDKRIKFEGAGENFLISGKKDIVLNGEMAPFFLYPISLANGKSIYILPKETRGIKINQASIMGMKTAGIVSLEFNKTELKKDFCLTPANQGEKALAEINNYSNIGFSAVSLGIAEAALEAAIKYSKERKQFGRAICQFPMVQEMLVDMKTKIENVRLLVYDAAAKYDKNENYSLASKSARLHSAEIAVSSSLKTIQIYGGYGYTKDYPVERYLRDAKVLQVLNKTPHDLKSEIAKELLI